MFCAACFIEYERVVANYVRYLRTNDWFLNAICFCTNCYAPRTGLLCPVQSLHASPYRPGTASHLHCDLFRDSAIHLPTEACVHAYMRCGCSYCHRRMCVCASDASEPTTTPAAADDATRTRALARAQLTNANTARAHVHRSHTGFPGAAALPQHRTRARSICV